MASSCKAKTLEQPTSDSESQLQDEEKEEEEEPTFLEQPPARYYCLICHSVMRDPHIVMCCCKKMCGACIERVQHSGQPCPNCRKPDFSTFLERDLNSEILDLKVRCTHHTNGCEWVGELRDLKKHTDPEKGGCGFIQVKCPYGCPMAYLRHESDNHESVCTNLPPELQIKRTMRATDQFKEELQVTLEQFQELYKLESERVRELTNQLETMKENHKKEEQEMKHQFEAEKKQLLEECRTEYQQQIKLLTQEMNKMKKKSDEDHQQQIASLKQHIEEAAKKQLAELKAYYQKELQKQYDSEMEQQREMLVQKEKQLEEQQQRQMEKMSTEMKQLYHNEHSQRMKEYKEQSENELQKLRQQYDQDYQHKLEEVKVALEKEKKRHLEETRNSLAAEKDKLVVDFKEECEKRKLAAQAALAHAECSVCAGGPATITTNCCNRSYCKPCLKQAFNLRKAINALDGTNKKLLQELNTLGYEDYYAFQAVKKGYDVFEAMEWLNELDDDEYLKIQHSLFCPVCWKPLEG